MFARSLPANPAHSQCSTPSARVPPAGMTVSIGTRIATLTNGEGFRLALTVGPTAGIEDALHAAQTREKGQAESRNRADPIDTVIRRRFSMRKLILSFALGLFALGIVATTPSTADAQRWGRGWNRGYYSG